jgi:hypothetical protein
VPLIVRVAELPMCQADVMAWPGANRSRHVPKFENEARASVQAVAPTVIAAGVRAGDELHAFAVSLPAATA